jgi:sulfotransferase family protein
MLSAHPQAFPLFETYVFSNRIGLGALFGPVPRTLGGGASGLAPPGLGRLFTRGDLVTEVRAIALRWLDAGVPEGTRFAIEKSPWHLHDLLLIAEVLPEARFVNVVRDGRDVAVSLLEARRSWSQVGPSEPAAVIAEAARAWRTGLTLADRASAELGEPMLEVRFESLRADPAVGCRELFEHCRMPATARDVEEAASLTALGVGDWRTRFGVRDALRFERIAGETLRETGYEPDRRWWLRQPLRSRL